MAKNVIAAKAIISLLSLPIRNEIQLNPRAMMAAISQGCEAHLLSALVRYERILSERYSLRCQRETWKRIVASDVRVVINATIEFIAMGSF